jgi:hypothetical protein
VNVLLIDDLVQEIASMLGSLTRLGPRARGPASASIYEMGCMDARKAFFTIPRRCAQLGGMLVPHHGFVRWMLVGFLAFTAACNTSYGAEVKKGSSLADRADRSGSPEVDGTWTPIVTLRDTTDKFPGG